MGIKSWQQCQNCQLCMFVKNSIEVHQEPLATPKENVLQHETQDRNGEYNCIPRLAVVHRILGQSGRTRLVRLVRRGGSKNNPMKLKKICPFQGMEEDGSI